MIPPPPVTVVIDGRIVTSSLSPANVAGTIAVPLDPYLRSVAGVIAVDDGAGTILIARGRASIVVKIGQRLARLGPASVVLPIAPYLRDGLAFIPLAVVARDLGGSADFDARSKTLNIAFPVGDPLVTPSPYVPVVGAPSPLPFRRDATATPGPSVTGIPQPRRTPIEAAP